jgi:hypothetical protein
MISKMSGGASTAVTMMEEGGLVVDTGGLLERHNIQNVVARKTIRYCLFVNSQVELGWPGVFA